MRAVTYTRFGGPEELRITEVADPVAGRGELVARVRAASINPLDWKIRTGRLRMLSGRTFPKQTGFDFSGIVESCGPDVDGLKPGDPIFGQTNPFFAGSGTFAEMCVTRRGLVTLMPAGLSFVEAASAPCAGLSAMQSLRLCKVGRGSKVMLIGASGGLGIFAIPFAKRLGARVTAVCSGHGIDLVKHLGADAVINRQAMSPLEAGVQYDAVMDLAAAYSFSACRHLLAPRGIYLNTMPGAGTIWSQCWTSFFSARKSRVLMMKPSGDRLDELGALMKASDVKPGAIRTFSFDDESVREMHRLSQEGHVLGKLVLELPGG